MYYNKSRFVPLRRKQSILTLWIYFSRYCVSERNRQHAKKSRSRKKCLTENLRQCLDDLKDENEKIRSQLYEKFGEDEIKSIVKQKMATPSDHFIMALKKPQNKAVSDETLTLLKQLSKKVQNKKLKIWTTKRIVYCVIWVDVIASDFILLWMQAWLPIKPEIPSPLHILPLHGPGLFLHSCLDALLLFPSLNHVDTNVFTPF